jgi:hypothetical protein
MLCGRLSPEKEAHDSPQLIRKEWHKENLWFSRESISSHAARSLATARHSGLTATMCGDLEYTTAAPRMDSIVEEWGHWGQWGQWEARGWRHLVQSSVLLTAAEHKKLHDHGIYVAFRLAMPSIPMDVTFSTEREP